MSATTPGVEERLRIWGHNAPTAMLALQNVDPTGAWDNLVVIIADMRDPIARTLVDVIGQAEGVDIAAHEAKAEKKGQIPTAAVVLEVSIAVEVFKLLDHPAVSDRLSLAPDAGHVRAVVISSGSATLLHPLATKLPVAGQS